MFLFSFLALSASLISVFGCTTRGPIADGSALESGRENGIEINIRRRQEDEPGKIILEIFARGRAITLRCDPRICIEYTVDDVVTHNVIDGLAASSADNSSFPRHYVHLYPVPAKSGINAGPLVVAIPVTYSADKWIGDGTFTARLNLLIGIAADSGEAIEKKVSIQGRVPRVVKIP